MFRPRHRGAGARAPGLAIWLLAAQIFQVGIDRIPPVTLITIGAQVALFLRLFKLPFGGPGNVCVSALEVWYKEDLKRLLLAAFYHADEWHLYFNMVSMLWKGLKLERKLGSAYFLYMIAVFVLLTNMLLVALNLGLEHVMDDHYYVRTCAVGFSGVLFALKVVSSHLSPPGTQYLLGIIPFPSRIACWAELVLIHILVPRSSFTAQSYTYRAERSGYSEGRGQSTGYRNNYARPAQHYDAPPSERDYGFDRYTGGLSEEEQMRRVMEKSIRESYQHNRAEPSAPPAYDNIPFEAPYPSSPDQGGMPTPPPPGYSQSGHTPPYPPTGSRLYPDLSPESHYGDTAHDMDEVRRRRLDRLAQRRN